MVRGGRQLSAGPLGRAAIARATSEVQMPKAAALIVTTIALDIVVQSAAVGIAFCFVLQRIGLRLTPRAAIGVPLVPFAALDLLWWPAIASSSASLTLHDPDLARFFHIPPGTPLRSLAGPGITDLLGWFLQAGVALWAATRLGLLGARRAA